MKILVAEDEKGMQYAIVKMLEISGYEADSAYDGEQALKMASDGAYDCMIFDIMMPKMDGIEVLKQIRSKGDVTPVIMLTAKAEVEDRIEGLDAGADDYLTKPFAMKELLARVRSQLRRKEDYTPQSLTLGNLTLDVEKQEMSARNDIRLAKKETRLLEYFLLNSDKELTTQEIYNHVWADESQVEKDVVWVYVSYLRQKLSSVDADVEIIGEKDMSFKLCEKV